MDITESLDLGPILPHKSEGVSQVHTWPNTKEVAFIDYRIFSDNRLLILNFNTGERLLDLPVARDVSLVGVLPNGDLLTARGKTVSRFGRDGKDKGIFASGYYFSQGIVVEDGYVYTIVYTNPSLILPLRLARIPLEGGPIELQDLPVWATTDVGGYLVRVGQSTFLNTFSAKGDFKLDGEKSLTRIELKKPYVLHESYKNTGNAPLEGLSNNLEDKLWLRTTQNRFGYFERSSSTVRLFASFGSQKPMLVVTQ